MVSFRERLEVQSHRHNSSGGRGEVQRSTRLMAPRVPKHDQAIKRHSLVPVLKKKVVVEVTRKQNMLNNSPAVHKALHATSNATCATERSKRS